MLSVLFSEPSMVLVQFLEAKKEMQSGDSYSSPFLLTKEQILEMGIPEHQWEMYRRKHYQVLYTQCGVVWNSLYHSIRNHLELISGIMNKHNNILLERLKCR